MTQTRYNRHEIAAMRDAYDRDGYLIIRNVIDQDLIADADRHVDWLLEQHPHLRPDQLNHVLARTDPFWHRLISDERLLDIAEVLLGPDLALFATHYICKEPRTGRLVPWHHDGGYWPLQPMDVATIWLAITTSDRDNGGLRIVPGSHKGTPAEMVPSDADGVLPMEVPVAVDESTAVDIELEPGDISLHHPNIVHGSEANTSDRWRRGLTIRYIPTSTKILIPENSSAFLLRGNPVPGVNEYLPTPQFDPATHMAYQS